jgi:hypothetical protein
VVVLVAQGVGQDERVECVGLGRGESVAFPRPGRDLRRDAEQLDSALEQVLDEHPLGPFDGGAHPTRRGVDDRVELAQSPRRRGRPDGGQNLAGLVDHA